MFVTRTVMKTLLTSSRETSPSASGFYEYTSVSFLFLRRAYKQRHKDTWYKKHSVLCGYRPSKAPRVEATGLSDIMSSLTTTDNGKGKVRMFQIRHENILFIKNNRCLIFMSEWNSGTKTAQSP